MADYGENVDSLFRHCMSVGEFRYNPIADGWKDLEIMILTNEPYVLVVPTG